MKNQLTIFNILNKFDFQNKTLKREDEIKNKLNTLLFCLLCAKYKSKIKFRVPDLYRHLSLVCAHLSQHLL